SFLPEACTVWYSCTPTLAQPVPPVEPQRQLRRARRCWGASTHSDKMACITHPPCNARGALPYASNPGSSAMFAARKRKGRERRDTVSGPEPPKGVCSGCVRKPVIVTIVRKSKLSRSAYGHAVSLVKSTDFVWGFAEPFSDTCLANHRLLS